MMNIKDNNTRIPNSNITASIREGATLGNNVTASIRKEAALGSNITASIRKEAALDNNHINLVSDTIDPDRIFVPYRYFESVSSTNDLMKQNILDHKVLLRPISDSSELSTGSIFTYESAMYSTSGESAPVMLYIASAQMSGRGRSGHSFYSPDEGVYFSLAFPVSLFPSPALYTVAAALCTARCLSDYTPEKIGIKWVNDIMISGRKICGILTEAISVIPNSPISHIIIGIGINLANRSFPDEISDIAGSLGINAASCTKDFKINLALKISRDILSTLKTGKESYLEQYKKMLCMLGSQASFKKGSTEYVGTAEDINSSGNLIVKLPSGNTVVIDSGEVIFN